LGRTEEEGSGLIGQPPSELEVLMAAPYISQRHFESIVMKQAHPSLLKQRPEFPGRTLAFIFGTQHFLIYPIQSEPSQFSPITPNQWWSNCSFESPS
jgi:hypothetical protein